MSTETNQEPELIERLRLLEDPEIGLNIVDLGMVWSASRDAAGAVCVEIIPTSPNCPMHEQISEGARYLLSSVPGVTSVEIIIRFDPPWTPEMITPAGREFLASR
ncbi:MAG: metal-sulfur cluster assembly factor [Nibricoccus sp.]